MPGHPDWVVNPVEAQTVRAFAPPAPALRR
jgi:hypothetical protein